MSQEQSTRAIFRRFSAYLTHYKLAFIAAIFGMIGYSAIDVFVISQLENAIDLSLVNGDLDYLRIAAYLIVPLFILRGIFNFMGAYTLSWIGNMVVMNLRQELFSRFVHLPVSFHDQNSSGQLISKVIYDTEQVSVAAGKALLILVRDGALVIGLLGIMFYKSWQLSLAFFVIGPVVAVIVSFVSKRFRTVSKNIQKSMGNLTTTVEQILQGHKVVLMFDGQTKEQDKFKERNNQNRHQKMKMEIARLLSVSTIQVIASIALAVVLFISSVPGMVENLTAGVFTSVIVSMTMLLKPLKQLTTINGEFQKGMAACESIFAVLDQQIEENSGTQKPEKVEGVIDFKQVSFKYPNKEETVLNNISFSVPEGQTLALVGRSGSGKSTISNLLTRFYQPQSGQIMLDSVPLSEIELRALRKQFALVSQNVTLFNDTIANNIAYGVEDKVTREQIIEAARVAHVIEFAEQLEKGLDTLIGENGFNLSGGQRQRIAIARAVLKDAPILILDEATSALDTESERFIQEALDELQRTRTSIVVAHRLSTIENADQILVIDKGNIIEQGKHQELLDQEGMYSQLHKMQFSESL